MFLRFGFIIIFFQSVSPEKTHITSLTTKTNAQVWNEPKKGQI